MHVVNTFVFIVFSVILYGVLPPATTSFFSKKSKNVRQIFTGRTIVFDVVG